MSPNKKNNKKVPLLNKKNSKENNNNSNENNEYYLTKKNRWFLLLIFTLIYILLMFNIGIFSSASSKIKLYLNIDNKKFGLFGSFNFIGRIFGTFLFMLIINKFNRKFILIIPLYLNSFCIFNFILTKNLIILYVFRTLNGICQNFGLIYFPMWIDQFGMKEKKTLMMTFIQLSAPIGMVFGYCFNTFFKSWKKGFLFESCGEIIFISILLFFPKKYFSKNLFFKGHFNSYFNVNNNNKQKISIFYNTNEIKNNNNLLKNIFSLLLNKMFLMTVLYKSTTQFICAGIGFWLTDYLENQLKIKNNLHKLYSYINIIVIGPMIGLFFGGIITNYTGGYEKKKSVFLIFIFQLICSLIGIFIPYFNNLLLFNIFTNLFFIFNSAVIPVNTGLILWSVNKNQRGIANAICSLITTFVGKIPAPIVYGMAQQNLGGRSGMIILMSSAFLGDVFLGLATVFRYKEAKIEKNIFENKEGENYVNKMRESINKNTVTVAFNTDSFLDEENDDFKENDDENNIPLENKDF